MARCSFDNTMMYDMVDYDERKGTRQPGEAAARVHRGGVGKPSNAGYFG